MQVVATVIKRKKVVVELIVYVLLIILIYAFFIFNKIDLFLFLIIFSIIIKIIEFQL
jgi:hypothetical protein